MTNDHTPRDMQNIDFSEQHQNIDAQCGKNHNQNQNQNRNRNQNYNYDDRDDSRKIGTLEREGAQDAITDTYSREIYSKEIEFKEIESRQIDFNQIALQQYQLQASPYQLFLQFVPASGRIGIWLKDNSTIDRNSAISQQCRVGGEEIRSRLLGYYCSEKQCWYHQNADIKLSSTALIEIEAYASGYALRRSADFSTKRTLAHYLSHYASYTL